MPIIMIVRAVQAAPEPVNDPLYIGADIVKSLSHGISYAYASPKTDTDKLILLIAKLTEFGCDRIQHQIRVNQYQPSVTYFSIQPTVIRY